MPKYNVKVGAINWGAVEAKDTEHLKKVIAQQIEKLHPLNSSDEGAEAYRQRFRGADIYIIQGKDYIKI